MADREAEALLNTWNTGWRGSTLYTDILRELGKDPTKPLKLSDQERKFVQAAIEAESGQPFAKGMEIDPAGNMNQNEGFGKQFKKWGPIAAAIAVTAFGVPGTAFGGLLGSGGAASTAGAATGIEGITMSSAPFVGGGVNAASLGGVGTAATAGASGAGMGIWDSVLGFVKGNAGDLIKAGGSMLSRGAQASADNRGTQIDIQLEQEKLRQQAERDYWNNVLAREEEVRASGNDAWKAAQAADYVKNWKAPETGRFSPYAKPITSGPSDAMRTAAGGRFDEANARLVDGPSIAPITRPSPFTVPDSLQTGGVWENIMGYGAAGLGAFSDAMRRRRTHEDGRVY